MANMKLHSEYPVPKILMVDDKPANLVAMEKVLQDVDAQLVKANSGNEALKQTLEHDFALALLDVQMPEMDGYELAEIMRKDSHTENIPIIFVSAIYTDRLNVFKGYEKGAFSFITKPFEPVKLLNKVKFFIEKYHTEIAYEESRIKYKKLYNSSPEMLFSVESQSGNILECNERTLEMTGLDKEHIRRMNVRDFFHGENRVEVEQAMEVFFNKGQVNNIELEMKPPGEEEELCVLLTIQSLDGETWDVCNFSIRDITELKDTRIRLKETLQKLKLQNKDLQHFIYLVSHDLREPMLTIISFLDLHEEEHGEEMTEESKEYMHYIRSAAERMNSLVTSVLDYLRIDRLVQKKVIDLNELFKEVIGEMQGSVQNSGAKIKTGELPQIKANESRMKQLFQNLLSNAIKYRKPDKHPEIEVKAHKRGNHWQFVMQDKGIGIPEKQYEKIFKIFKQLHRHGEYEGMGMGLALCKKIIESYEGSIWVQSEVGKGTSFFFTLPAD